LADDVIAHDIESPAVMVIGEVARERGAIKFDTGCVNTA
jgi:hypothetical protein